MRKSDNKRPGAGSKGREFKSKDKARPGGKPARGGAYSDRPKKRDGDSFSAGKERPGGAERKPRRSFSDDTERPRRRESGGSESDRGRRPYRSDGDSPRRSFGSDDKPRRSAAGPEDRPRRSSSDRDARPRGRGKEDKPSFGSFKGAKGGKYANRETGAGSEEKHRRSSRSFDEPKRSKRDKDGEDGTKRVKFGDFEEGRAFSGRSGERAKPGKRAPKKAAPVRKQNDDGLVRLNKYLSNAGVASRREADTLIQSGVVKVNGVVVDQLGHKINPNDRVTYGDAPVRSERKVYLLLNKPKDYITTTDDPQERKTVMELIAKACKERVYPVGRLDRNTTGLLLFTNDGELTTKLMHPKFNIKKIYHVSLNKGLKPDDFHAITEGIELEDGMIKADDLAFVGEGKKEIGIEIHSGRNRIVRRIFEHLGYDVLKLDRVAFAGLTKKDLPRGKHRFLTAKEIGFLQMIG